MVSDDPTLTALGRVRDRARRAVTSGRPGGLLDPRSAIDDYKAALANCPLDHDALGAAREELVARLDKGLTLAGDDPVVGDLFGTLLSRYEACEDVLDREAARRRLAAWELRLADAMLAAGRAT